MKLKVNKSWASGFLKKNALIMDMVVAGSLIALMHQQPTLPPPVIVVLDLVLFLLSEVLETLAFQLKEGKPCISLRRCTA